MWIKNTLFLTYSSRCAALHSFSSSSILKVSLSQTWISIMFCSSYSPWLYLGLKFSSSIFFPFTFFVLKLLFLIQLLFTLLIIVDFIFYQLLAVVFMYAYLPIQFHYMAIYFQQKKIKVKLNNMLKLRLVVFWIPKIVSDLWK